MNMEEVKKLMKEVGWGFLGTTDGKIVGVRPMGGWAWIENELWCASMKSTDKISQLQTVAYAEYCFCAKEGTHVRIGGPCEISSDDDEKLRLYNANPVLKDHIDDPASPDYVVIKLRPDRIRMMEATDLAYTQIELPEK
ncbi:MAG: pyridoxamine 5'-phosphate oxidase family protein [Planctomycetota bacterium]|jgi:general stress protein 26